jgi:hypothetical protein
MNRFETFHYFEISHVCKFSKDFFANPEGRCQ